MRLRKQIMEIAITNGSTGQIKVGKFEMVEYKIIFGDWDGSKSIWLLSWNPKEER